MTLVVGRQHGKGITGIVVRMPWGVNVYSGAGRLLSMSRRSTVLWETARILLQATKSLSCDSKGPIVGGVFF